MKGIFHPDKWNDWDTPFPHVQEIRKLDPVEDKYYLEYLVQHAYGSRRNVLMKKLGFSEIPERRVNPRDPEDDQYEEYLVLREQVAREPDAEILKEAALLFMEMSRKSEQLGKYTQRWEAFDDYARGCIAAAELTGFASEAEKAAGDPSGWTSDVMLNRAGTPFGQEVSAVHSWAVLEAAGYKTYFTFLNTNNYGLKWLDCLDLQKLMTDSDFLHGVCMACNAGGESPHVFPADSTVCGDRGRLVE